MKQASEMTSKLSVVFVTDVMQDVRLVEGFAEVFDLTVLVPEYLSTRFVTWPAEGAFSLAVLPGGRARFVFAASRWLLKHREHQVIIAQDNLTAALAGNLAGFLTKRPVILRMGRTTVEYYRSKRASGKWGPKYWLGLFVVRILVSFNERAARAVGATSRYIANASAARSKDVRVIPAYGVDLELFSPKLSKVEARKHLDLPVDKRLILWRSRLAPEKDPETYFKAMVALREEGRDVVGVYVGGEYNELSKRAEPFKFPLIARDHVPPRELAVYYRAADVAVQTSKAEGFGISPLEALACGTPVVASAVGGLVETIIDGKTGLTVPMGDVQSTARAIARLLDDPDEAERLARSGREHVAANYSRRIAFDGWKSLALELAAERR